MCCAPARRCCALRLAHVLQGLQLPDRYCIACAISQLVRSTLGGGSGAVVLIWLVCRTPKRGSKTERWVLFSHHSVNLPVAPCLTRTDHFLSMSCLRLLKLTAAVCSGASRLIHQLRYQLLRSRRSQTLSADSASGASCFCLAICILKTFI